MRFYKKYGMVAHRQRRIQTTNLIARSVVRKVPSDILDSTTGISWHGVM